jgi:hypothetical protein
MSPVFGRLDPRRGIVAVAIFAVLVATTTAGSLPTKGPIPPQAFRLDGPLDPSLLPDFVPAQGRDGQIAGYVPKAYLTGSPAIGNTTGGPTGDVAPVFAADLQTLVGHMVSHSIDFHAAQIAWSRVYQEVRPGASASFDWTHKYPGVFMYHCGSAPVLMHMADGMSASWRGMGAAGLESRTTRAGPEAIGVENDFVAVRELGPRTVSMSLILTSCP